MDQGEIFHKTIFTVELLFLPPLRQGRPFHRGELPLDSRGMVFVTKLDCGQDYVKLWWSLTSFQMS